MTETTKWSTPTDAEIEGQRLLGALKDTSIPGYMRSSVIGYLTGEQPYVGGFLDALLKNDLRRTVIRADPQNAECLSVWIRFLINHAPSQCWGSPDKVSAWQDRRMSTSRADSSVPPPCDDDAEDEADDRAVRAFADQCAEPGIMRADVEDP